MSLLQAEYKQKIEEEKRIRDNVNSETVRPTETESVYVNKIIQKISNKFAKELKTKTPNDISDAIIAAIHDESLKYNLGLEETLRVQQVATMTVLGYGPIEEFIKDPDVTEIVVQRYDNIVVEKNGKIIDTQASFIDDEHLVNAIQRIVQLDGKQINIVSPIVDTTLQNGSRVNATIPPISADGATLTIRKFSQQMLSGEDYIKSNCMSKQMMYFLNECVAGRINIFVSGGTGTGKTTMLNMLSHAIPQNELIITIEDTLELQLQQPNVRRMRTRSAISENMEDIDQEALLKAALRQRPDRIILGETRDGSIIDLISAMSTGHEGSMSTIHANDPDNMCNVRIPILYGTNSKMHFSERSIALQIAEAIQIIVQLSRMPDGSRKVTHIAVVEGVDDNCKVITKDVFYYDSKIDKFLPTGYVPHKIIEKAKLRVTEFDESVFRVPRHVKEL